MAAPYPVARRARLIGQGEKEHQNLRSEVPRRHSGEATEGLLPIKFTRRAPASFVVRWIVHVVTDRVTKEKRSWMMSRVKGRDTGPERAVRTLLHKMGFRFRLHDKNLPGKPDLT